MIAAILLMTVAGLAPTPACPIAPMTTSLSQAVGQTLTSVRSSNAKALLAQMSPQGVAFGGANAIVPYAALTDQFGRQNGRYCDLFACQGQAGRLNALFNGGRMQRSLDAGHGRAHVVLNAGTTRALDLGYAYTTQCKWALTSIGAP